MSIIDFFRDSCFPGGPDPGSVPIKTPTSSFQTFLTTILNRYRSQPRWAAMAIRHPENRAGMISLDEHGNVSIRPGNTDYDHRIGASLTLTQSGHALLTAPAGLGLSGDSISSSVKPSQMFKFLGGKFQFNPVWEDDAYTLTPKVDLSTVYVLQSTGGKPVPVPILSLFTATPLYTLCPTSPETSASPVTSP